MGKNSRCIMGSNSPIMNFFTVEPPQGARIGADRAAPSREQFRNRNFTSCMNSVV